MRVPMRGRASSRSEPHFVNCEDVEWVEEAQSALVPWQTTQAALDERRSDESIVRVKVEG
jgi:hypothetical protein